MPWKPLKPQRPLSLTGGSGGLILKWQRRCSILGHGPPVRAWSERVGWDGAFREKACLELHVLATAALGLGPSCCHHRGFPN